MAETSSTQRVNHRTIAEHCGVSTWTVSSALRQDPRVAPATRERVIQAALELGYDPAQHEAARRLVSLRYHQRHYTHIISFLMPPRFDTIAYFAQLFHGMLGESIASGYAPLAITGAELTAVDHPVWTIFHRGDVDGLLVSEDPAITDEVISHLRQHPGFADRPIVTINHHRTGCVCVQGSHFDGAYKLASHLLGCGHRHLCQMLYPDDRDRMQQRLLGIRAAMREYGYDPDTCLHTYALTSPHSSWINSSTGTAVYLETPLVDDPTEATHFVTYMRVHPQITAVLALNDPSALCAWHTLRAAGYRIPEEVSIAGFDNTLSVLDAAGNSLLTTVHVPLSDLGRLSTRALLQHVASPERAEQEYAVPLELVVRASTVPVGPRNR